ncbi:AMP-dependent synthetase/ligase [Rubrivirga sp.]|uniref:AMP-dependent synthetase/ligase n=1 Tax=Rubrivirga sp. TaxID=1885344 RepID=UPI003C754B1C
MPAVVEFDTAAQLVQRLAARYAGTGKAALGYKDKATKQWTDITWDDLDGRVRAFASWLAAQGVVKGDRVAILSENRPEWAVADLATQLLGAATVALYTSTPTDDAAFILRDSGAKVLVASTRIQLRKGVAALDSCPDLEAVVSMIEPRTPDDRVTLWDAALEGGAAQPADLDARADAVTPDDLSALIYTSGTTGQPKGVQMTHRNLMSNAHAAHQRYDITEDDVHLSFLPLSHAFERTCGYATVLAAGAQIVYAESVDAIAKNLPEVQPTLVVAVPRLFERIYTTIHKTVEAAPAPKRLLFAWAKDVGGAAALSAKEGRTIGPVLRVQNAVAQRLVFKSLHDKLGGRLRLAISGGAALPTEIGEFFEAAGIRLIEGYGLSETAPVLAANPYNAPRYGTVGWVMPGVTVAIRDLEDGTTIDALEGDDYPTSRTTVAGEIVAKGPNVMPGYWQRPGATDAAFDADGWFLTGDVGRFEDGYLRITDRLKHMIVSRGGKNIYPGPLEAELSSSPLVDQIMVVGEGRAFLTALVVPDHVAAQIVSGSSDLEDDAFRAPFDALLKAYNRGAPSHEKVRDLRFVHDPFTVENGLLTPTMKLKRRTVEDAYSALIEQMYDD